MAPATTDNEKYAEYDGIVTKIIEETRGMAHCDQWVLHAPAECEYCDRYPELQQARMRLGINYTGHNDPLKITCPAETRRGLDKIERWHGNVKMDAAQKEADDAYWAEFHRVMRESFPDWEGE